MFYFVWQRKWLQKYCKSFSSINKTLNYYDKSIKIDSKTNKICNTDIKCQNKILQATGQWTYKHMANTKPYK